MWGKEWEGSSVVLRLLPSSSPPTPAFWSHSSSSGHRLVIVLKLEHPQLCSKQSPFSPSPHPSPPLHPPYMHRQGNEIWMCFFIVHLCQQSQVNIWPSLLCQSPAVMFQDYSTRLGLLMCVQCTQSCLKGPACYHCTRVQPSVRWSLGQLLITLYRATEASDLNDNSVLGNNLSLSVSISFLSLFVSFILTQMHPGLYIVLRLSWNRLQLSIWFYCDHLWVVFTSLFRLNFVHGEIEATTKPKNAHCICMWICTQLWCITSVKVLKTSIHVCFVGLN